jgi:hypothetical protein
MSICKDCNIKIKCGRQRCSVCDKAYRKTDAYIQIKREGMLAINKKHSPEKIKEYISNRSKIRQIKIEQGLIKMKSFLICDICNKPKIRNESKVCRPCASKIAIRTDEWKRKISESQKGKIISPEQIKKFVEKMKGRVSPLKGIPKLHLRGDKNPCWKGGRNERMQLMGQVEYINWRKMVFERDNYTCQFCGKRGCKIQADHILAWATHPESRYDINNGRTLCIPCHRMTDTYGGRGMKKDIKTKTMKKITLTILIALSILKAPAQDSLHVSGLVLPAYIYALTMGSYSTSADSSKINPAMRVLVTIETTSNITYNTSITAGAISTATIADMYRIAYNTPAYTGAASTFKTALVTLRANNNYLNTLCTTIENNATAQLISQVNNQIQAWRGY